MNKKLKIYGIIYKVVCIINNKLYIGATRKDISKRRRQHENLSVKSNYIFHNALQKYGFENFNWSIIAIAYSEKELSNLEKKYIKEFDSTNKECGYNMSEGGVSPVLSGCLNGMFGKKHSEKVKEILRKRMKGKTWEELLGPKKAAKAKMKLSKANIGRKNTAETLKKMSDSSYWKGKGELLKGRLNPNYGNYWTDEMREKGSGENNGMYGKGYLLSGKNNGMYGKTHSDKLKARYSKMYSGEGNPNYKKIDENKLKKIFVLYNQGYSIPYISDKTNTDRNKIRRELQRKGIKMRSINEQRTKNRRKKKSD